MPWVRVGLAPALLPPNFARGCKSCSSRYGQAVLITSLITSSLLDWRRAALLAASPRGRALTHGSEQGAEQGLVTGAVATLGMASGQQEVGLEMSSCNN